MSRTFDLQSLLTGDLSQIHLFMESDGPRSLYIEWVPNEMTKETAEYYFSTLGVVKAVDFVKQKMGNARMMFIHFERFHKRQVDVESIAFNHPNPYEMAITFKTQNPQYLKTYILRCRINTKPIPRVEYNPAQLTDMVDRLRIEIEALKQEVAELKKARDDDCDKRIQNV
jgi:hypothetical protein